MRRHVALSSQLKHLILAIILTSQTMVHLKFLHITDILLTRQDIYIHLYLCKSCLGRSEYGKMIHQGQETYASIMQDSPTYIVLQLQSLGHLNSAFASRPLPLTQALASGPQPLTHGFDFRVSATCTRLRLRGLLSFG